VGCYRDFDPGPEYIQKKNDAYREKRYHQPWDEYDPATKELSVVRFDAQLMYEFGLELANGTLFPDGTKAAGLRRHGKVVILTSHELISILPIF